MGRSALRDAGRYTDKQAGSQSHSLRNSRASSPSARHSPRNSWIESVHVQRRPSSVSVSSVQVDVDSCASSPGILRKPVNVDITFAEMKRALAEPSMKEREAEEKERKQLQQKFQTASFGELCELTLANRNTETLYSDMGSRKSSISGVSVSYDTTDLLSPVKGVQKPIYEEYFPELFTY